MHKRLAIVVAFVLFALPALAACGGDDGDQAGDEAAKPAVTIGTKNFPEQYVLGELYKQALEEAGFTVVLKSDVGATEIIHRALESGTLDLYPEYIGVLASEVAGETERARNADDVYETAKRYEERMGFTLLERTPFQNRDALAVTPAFARRHDLKEISDLASVPGKVAVGAPPEFRTRFEGYVGLRRLYRLRNLTFTPLPIGDQYRALDSGSIEAADVFTTDGQLVRGRYVVLDDPRNVFGFQHVAPVVSRKVLREQGPEFAETINAVTRSLDTAAMQRMNAQVALEERPPEQVAREFLANTG